MEQDLFDEATNVASPGGVDVLAAVAAHGHEAGETQLGEMLTCRRRGGTSELGERSHVLFPCGEQPQDPQPGVVGKQPERHDGDVDLLVGRLIKFDRFSCFGRRCHHFPFMYALTRICESTVSG